MPEVFDAIVAGHICLDITPDFSRVAAGKFMSLLQPGRLLDAGPATLAGGGVVSNTGRGFQVLGVKTLLMGKIGEDLFGQALRQILAAGSQGMIVDPSAQTSYTVVISAPGVDRIFLHCTGANDTFSADDVRYDLLSTSRLFHFGYPPLMRRMYEDGGEQLAAVFRRARATGVTTSLDVAWPDPDSAAGRADWPRILAAALPCVDVFLPSAEEIIFMLRRSLYEELRQAAGGGDILPLLTPGVLFDLSEELLGLGVRIAGLKLGQYGFYLRTGNAAQLAAMGRAAPADPAAWANRELWAPVFRPRQIVTSTGAGDTAIAGFLCGLLHGLTPEAALTAACAVGACNLEAADATGGLLNWDATLARMAAGWQRGPLDVSGWGWRYDDAAGLWRKD